MTAAFSLNRYNPYKQVRYGAMYVGTSMLKLRWEPLTGRQCFTDVVRLLGWSTGDLPHPEISGTVTKARRFDGRVSKVAAPQWEDDGDWLLGSKRGLSDTALIPGCIAVLKTPPAVSPTDAMFLACADAAETTNMLDYGYGAFGSRSESVASDD